MPRSTLEDLLARVATRDFTISVVGMGYVGLPLALTALSSGFKVIGFDIDESRVACLNRGESGMAHISGQGLAAALADCRFYATAATEVLAQADAIVIAVPTPLSQQREPNLTFVESSARTVAKTLRRGQLVVLESTTWPGTTREIVQPILEATGLVAGYDFHLAFSPEREDPGNATFGTATIPKVVGADHPDSLRLACLLYDTLVVKTIPVSSTAAAEATKLTENIFRSVNIALVNELKVVFAKMGIDVWEVIDAAATKPFGFMPFYPGPGLGGHCIPIDPFYLTWKAREFEVATRFIELAGEINTAMPDYVVTRLAEEIDRRFQRGLNGSRILIIGVAYKKNIGDTRESPSLKLMSLIEKRGADTDYHDPFVAEIPRTREHSYLQGRKSIPLSGEVVATYDAVLIATDHDAIDWPLLARHSKLIVDTRNVFARRNLVGNNIAKS